MNIGNRMVNPITEQAAESLSSMASDRASHMYFHW
jgi:hypothetical protein